MIGNSIRSVWALELLLLLMRNTPAAMSRPALVRELRASAPLVDTCVDQLEKAGLIACDGDGGCRYAPASAMLEELCAKLAAAYGERPLAVIDVIHAARSDRLTTFANAFRFNKKDD